MSDHGRPDSPPHARPLLPHPLQQRVRSGHLVLGVFLPLASELATALREFAPLPLRLVCIGAEASVEWTEANNGDRLETCPLEPAALATVLPQLEAALLSAALVETHSPLLTQLAVPMLVDLGAEAPTGWDGPGLAVAGAEPRALAGLLLLLATDPPTRRRALDSQCAALTDSAEGCQPYWRVEGVFDSSYSLAIVNRRLALALEETGTQPVALLTYEQGEQPQPRFESIEDAERIRALWARGHEPRAPRVALRNAWPPVVRDMRGQRRVLTNYAWEETGFPEEYAQDFNRVQDLITTVSRQTARFLQDAGSEVPIAVVGNGIDHLLAIAPEPPPLRLPDGLRLLHLSSCLPRKGLDVLLRAYGEAFRATQDVTLIIKTQPNPHNDVAAQLQAWREHDPGFPRVILRMDDWRPGQIVGLYRACSALIAPSRGEGFGLPIAEAMLHLCPVVVTGWGGHMDYCDAETAWLIDYRLVPAASHLSRPGSLWAEPDAVHLAQLLRELQRAPPQRARLEQARTRILERYTWRQVAKRVRAALTSIDAQPGPLPAVRIGWLSTWGSRCGIAAYSAHLSAAIPEADLAIFAPINEQAEHPDPPGLTRTWHLGGNDLRALLDAATAARLDLLVIQYHWAFFALDALLELLAGLTARGIGAVLDLHNTLSAPAAIREARYRDALAGCRRVLVHGVEDVQRLQEWGLSDNVTLLPLAVYRIPWPEPAATAALRASLLGGADSQPASAPPTARRLARFTRWWKARSDPSRRDPSRTDVGPILATFGYLMPHKGLLQMIEAMPEILQRHPGARLLMVNALYRQEVSVPEEKRLRARMHGLALQDRVILETRYLAEADCVAWLRAADLVVFPYQHSEESSSAAVRMALSAGRPIAVTPLPFFADVQSATHQLPGTDPAALAVGCVDLLDHLAQPAQRQAAEQAVAHLADAYASTRLAERLRGMLVGIARELTDRSCA